MIRKLFILAQDDDLAELYGKLLDRGTDLLLLDIAHIDRIGICSSVHCFVRIIAVPI